MASSTSLTRDALLKSMSAVYLVAFMSLYLQLPGLLGSSGVLPAHTQLTTSGSTVEAFLARPTLLWWRGSLGLDTSRAMDLVALAGAALALLGVLFQTCRTALTFSLLLASYMSLVQVGQVFLFFQWDSLLLEAGLLAVVLAPCVPAGWADPTRPGSGLALWLVRWLLFRVTFSTGVVKMMSQCPAWWDLSALQAYFQSQPLPTPAAAYAHHLPAAVLRLAAVGSIVVELAVPFLYFAPVRRIRLVAGYLQALLQLSVLLTGSFGFYNVLVLVLCLSLVDDDWLSGDSRRRRGGDGRLPSLASLAVFGALQLAVVGLFDLRVDMNGVTCNIAFSKADLGEFVRVAVPGSVLLAGSSFLLTAADALTSAVLDTSGCCRRLNGLLRTVTVVVMTAAVFCCSLVPYTTMEQTSHDALPSGLKHAFADHVQPFHLFGSYGIFKQMTGVGGRPEIVLEGSHSLNGPWREIEFRYKPGNVSTRPALVAPHQPRLDWQMWMGALGDYHANAWLTSLAYRLLTAQPDVLSLLDTARYPFADRPPKYVRGLRYTYHLTPAPLNWWTAAGSDSSNNWWVRDPSPEEYLPAFSADHKPLLDYLKQLKIIDNPEAAPASPNLALIGALDWLRVFFNQWLAAAPSLLWALLVTCWVVSVTRRRLS